MRHHCRQRLPPPHETACTTPRTAPVRGHPAAFASRRRPLKGKAAIANARLAYQAYEEVIASQRWQKLAGLGAQPQRPLWASTGIKNHAYPDTMYVTELVAAGTVNTMPGTTLAAFADHGEVTGNTITH